MVTGPAHGSLTLNGDGSFTYTPAASFTGVDSFTFLAFDGIAYSNVATVSIVVSPVNLPPVANNDSYSTAEDTALTVAAPGVLANDKDPDGDPITAVLVTEPADGTLTLNADGSFTYTPATGFSGTDTFTYQASDGLTTSGAATVTLTVVPSGQASLIQSDTTTEGNWIKTYGAQGYDVIGEPAGLPGYATITPSGQSSYTWASSTSDPRALQVPGGTGRIAATWYSATSFKVDRGPHRRPGARPRALLRRLGQPGPCRAGADQRRDDGCRAEHAVDLVVPIGRVPGLPGQRRHRDHDHADGRGQRRAQRAVPRRDSTHADGVLPQAGHDDARDVDQDLRRPGLRRHRRARRPARLRHRHALRPVELYLGVEHHRRPRLAGPRRHRPDRRHLVLGDELQGGSWTSPTARRTTSSSTSSTGTTGAAPSRCRSATRRRAPC